MSWRENLCGYSNGRPTPGMSYYQDPGGYMPGLTNYPLIGGLQSMGPPPSQPPAMLPVGTSFPPSMGYVRPHSHDPVGMMRPFTPRFLPGSSDHSAPMYMSPGDIVPSPSPGMLPGSAMDAVSDMYGVASPGLTSGSYAFSQRPLGPPSMPYVHQPGAMPLPPVPHLVSPGAPSVNFLPKPPPLKLAPTMRNTPSASSSNSASQTPAMSPAQTWRSPMTSPDPTISRETNTTSNTSSSPATVSSWHTPVTTSQQGSPSVSSSQVSSGDPVKYIYRRERDKYICNECSCTCPLFDQMMSHIALHTSIRACYECGRVFSKYIDLTRHMEGHFKGNDRNWDPVTGEKVTSSGNTSGTVTLSTSELYGDQSSWHTPVTSSQNESPVASLHVRSSDDSGTLIYGMENEKFRCNECQYICRQFDQMMLHIRSHTAVRACYVCGTVFTKHIDLTRHMKDHHKSTSWNSVSGEKATRPASVSATSTISTTELYGDSDKSSSRLLSSLTPSVVPEGEPSEAVFRVLRHHAEPTSQATTSISAVLPSSTYNKDSVAVNQEHSVTTTATSPTPGTIARFVDMATRLNNSLSSRGRMSGHKLQDLCDNLAKANSSCIPTTTSSIFNIGTQSTISSRSSNQDNLGCTATMNMKQITHPGSMMDTSDSTDQAESSQALSIAEDVMREIIHTEVEDSSREIAAGSVWPTLEVIPRTGSRTSADGSQPLSSISDNVTAPQGHSGGEAPVTVSLPPAVTHSEATDSEILAALYGSNLKTKHVNESNSVTNVLGLTREANSLTNNVEENQHAQNNHTSALASVMGGGQLTHRDSSHEDALQYVVDASETETVSSQDHAPLESSSASSLPQTTGATDNAEDSIMQIQIQDIRSCAESSVSLSNTELNSNEMGGNDENLSSTEADSNPEPLISLPEYTSIEGNIVDLAAEMPQPISYPIQNMSLMSPPVDDAPAPVSPNNMNTSNGSCFSSPKPRTGNGYRCHICNYEGRTEKSLQKHIRAHSSSYKICQYCKKAFERPSDLARHEERHERNMQKTGGDPSLISKGQILGVSGPDGSVPAFPSPEEKYTCKKCGFVANRFHKLALHNRQKHSVKHCCKYCPMVFISPLPLGNHMKRCPMKPLDDNSIPLQSNPNTPKKNASRRNMFVPSTTRSNEDGFDPHVNTTSSNSTVAQNSQGMMLPTMPQMFNGSTPEPRQVSEQSTDAAKDNMGIGRLDNFKKNILLKSDLVEVTIGDDNELVISFDEIDDKVFQASVNDIPLCSDPNEAKMIIASNVQLCANAVVSDDDLLDTDNCSGNESSGVLKVPSPFALVSPGPPPTVLDVNRMSQTDTLSHLEMSQPGRVLESGLSLATSAEFAVSNISSHPSNYPMLSSALLSRTMSTEINLQSVNLTPTDGTATTHLVGIACPTDETPEPNYAMSESTDSNLESIDLLARPPDDRPGEPLAQLKRTDTIPDSTGTSLEVPGAVAAAEHDNTEATFPTCLSATEPPCEEDGLETDLRIPDNTTIRSEYVHQSYITSESELYNISKPTVIRPVPTVVRPRQQIIRPEPIILLRSGFSNLTEAVPSMPQQLATFPSTTIQSAHTPASHYQWSTSVLPSSAIGASSQGELDQSTLLDNKKRFVRSERNSISKSVKSKTVSIPVAEKSSPLKHINILHRDLDAKAPVVIEICNANEKKRQIVFVPVPKCLKQASTDLCGVKRKPSTSPTPAQTPLRMYPSPPQSVVSMDTVFVSDPKRLKQASTDLCGAPLKLSTSLTPAQAPLRMYPSPTGNLSLDKVERSLRKTMKRRKPRKTSSPISDDLQVMRPNAVRHKESRYYCKRCNYGTDAKPKMDEHMRAHTGRFICKHCNKACIKASDLYRHWVTHNLRNDNKEYVCDTCDFTSMSKDIVMNHLRIHYLLKLTPFPKSHNIAKCGLCGKSFTRSQLFVHKKMAHSNKPVSVTSAAASLRNARGWSNRSKPVPTVTFDTRMSLQCPDCSEVFRSEVALNAHYKSKHYILPSRLEPQEKNLITESGPSTATNTSVTGTEEPNTSQSQGEEANVKCSYCPRTFKSKRHLIGHQKVHYTSTRKRSNTKSKPPRRRHFRCPHCLKRFKSQYYMAQHLRLHTGEKPYQCLKCGERFTLSQACQNHIRRGCPARRERHHVMANTVDDPSNDEDYLMIDSIPAPSIEIVTD